MFDADARLKELQSHWRKAAAAAKEIGYEKPDEQSWDDAAIEIVKLEQSQLADKPSDKPDKYQARGIYPTAWYRANGIAVCSKCGEQYLSDGYSPICAESFPVDVCPRLSAAA